MDSHKQHCCLWVSVPWSTPRDAENHHKCCFVFLHLQHRCEKKMREWTKEWSSFFSLSLAASTGALQLADSVLQNFFSWPFAIPSVATVIARAFCLTNLCWLGQHGAWARWGGGGLGPSLSSCKLNFTGARGGGLGSWNWPPGPPWTLRASVGFVAVSTNPSFGETGLAPPAPLPELPSFYDFLPGPGGDYPWLLHPVQPARGLTWRGRTFQQGVSPPWMDRGSPPFFR